MHLPELRLLDARHGRIGFDVADDGADALARVGHQEHEAEGVDEAAAEDAHGEGDGAGQEAVEPGVHLDGEEGEQEEDEGAGDREEVGRVAEDGGEGFDVGEAHHFADAGVVLQAEGGDDGGYDGEECRCVEASGGDSRVLVGVVGLVAEILEEMLEVVGDEVHAHEREEDGHGEAGQHFRPFEAEWMPDA